MDSMTESAKKKVRVAVTLKRRLHSVPPCFSALSLFQSIHHCTSTSVLINLVNCGMRAAKASSHLTLPSHAQGVSVSKASVPNNVPPSPLTAFAQADDKLSGQRHHAHAEIYLLAHLLT